MTFTCPVQRYLYKVLGVRRGYKGSSKIRSEYRHRALDVHPDKVSPFRFYHAITAPRLASLRIDTLYTHARTHARTYA